MLAGDRLSVSICFLALPCQEAHKFMEIRQFLFNSYKSMDYKIYRSWGAIFPAKTYKKDHLFYRKTQNSVDSPIGKIYYFISSPQAVSSVG